MKNNRIITTNDVIDNRLKMSNHQPAVPRLKLLSGSLANKYPVVMDDGRTTIFISDERKAAETKEKYEMRSGNHFISQHKKAKT